MSHGDTVVVAGAAGAVGSALLAALKARGRKVRALVRRPPSPQLSRAADEVLQVDALSPETLEGAFTGASCVASCVGASVSPSPSAGRAGYRAVDVPANRNLVEAAKAQGVRRFVYVSAHGARKLSALSYFGAHAEVEELLERSGLGYGVVRPTGIFTAFDAFLEMAAKGPATVIGDGSAKTNPIHPDDVAAAVADAVLTEGNVTLDVGGPEVLTRREAVERAFAAVGKPPRIRSVPPGLARAMSAVMRPFHPRLGELAEFVVAVSTQEVVAPQVGSKTLGDYFAQRAADLLGRGNPPTLRS